VSEKRLETGGKGKGTQWEGRVGEEKECVQVGRWWCCRRSLCTELGLEVGNSYVGGFEGGEGGSEGMGAVRE